MLKRIINTLVLGALGLAWAIGCTRTHPDVSDPDKVKVIFLADGLHMEDLRAVGDNFASAFALDESCKGLTLVRESTVVITSAESELMMRALNGPHWFLDVAPVPDLHNNWKPTGEVQWEIHLTGPRMGILEQSSGVESSAAGAAHKMCFIAGHKGGQVY